MKGYSNKNQKLKLNEHNRQILSICLLCFIIIVLISSLCIKDIVVEGTQLLRIHETGNQNLLYSKGLIVKSNTFKVLNDKILLYNSKHKAINTDVYMAIDGVEYNDNLFGVTEILGDYECLISRNLLLDSGLKLLDYIEDRQGIQYKIVGVLPAQKGLDEMYMNKGVIILSDESKDLNLKKEEYLCFIDNFDGLAGISNIDHLDTMEKASLVRFTITFLCELAIVIGVILLGEGLSKRVRTDYTIKVSYGMDSHLIMLNIIKDLNIKYIIPMLLNLLIFIKFGIEYGLVYFLLCISLLLIVSLSILIFATTYLYRRMRKCKKSVF